MAIDYIGIDLGSNQTRVFSSKKDEIVFQQPTCISYFVNDKKIDNIGILAEKTTDRSFANYKIVYPISNGLVNDDVALYDYIKRIYSEKKISPKATLIFSIPSVKNNVNESILKSLAARLRAKKVILSSYCELAAYGEDENVNSPQAMLIVNIGSEITDIGVLSLGQIIASSSTNVAGKTFDEAIRRYMIKERHLEISNDVSEQVKIMLADVSLNPTHNLFEVKGKDTITSLPSTIVVTSEEINKVLLPIVEYIVMEISDVIYSLSATFTTDVVKSGILLSGGGCLLTGLKEKLKSSLQIPIRIARNPKDTIIIGIRNKIYALKEEIK